MAAFCHSDFIEECSVGRCPEHVSVRQAEVSKCCGNWYRGTNSACIRGQTEPAPAAHLEMLVVFSHSRESSCITSLLLPSDDGSKTKGKSSLGSPISIALRYSPLLVPSCLPQGKGQERLCCVMTRTCCHDRAARRTCN